MNQNITFTVDDPIAFKVGDVFKPNGMTKRYQVVRAWINGDGKPEYEAKCIDLNRHELRKRLKLGKL